MILPLTCPILFLNCVIIVPRAVAQSYSKLGFTPQVIFELEQGLPFTFLYVTCAVFELKSLGAAAQTCHLILALCSEGCSTLAEEKVNSNGNVKKKNGALQNWRARESVLSDHVVIFCTQCLCKTTFIRRKVRINGKSWDKCSRQSIWLTDGV